MINVRLYDSLKSKLIDFKSIKKDVVTMYVCGPTIYNLIHIGNARPIIVFDSMRRFFEYIGYKVIMAQNFTDIDDKIINKANETGADIKTVSERYINEYWKDITALNVRPANFHPKTTDYVNEIINYIEVLIEKGFAYVAENNDVYFDVKKFEKYGELSHRKIEDMVSGTRIEANEAKKDVLDFVLWKASKEGEPYWESSWGKGRPGWHIECSAMSTSLLGETFDIHAGGNDLLFPHHENERAQSIAKTGKEFANYWIHNGMLKISGDKMSKSIGNIWLVREAVEKYGADTVKIFMLSKHYRAPIELDEAGLASQKISVDRVNNILKSAEDYFEGFVPDIEKTNFMKEKIKEFTEYLSLDFNTPKTIALVFNLSKELANALNEKAELKIKETYHLIRNEIGTVLGAFEKTEKVEDEKTNSDEFIKALIEIRNKMRKEKNYEMSDYIRDKLLELNVIIKDTPEGTEFSYK
jgi:cysteinyl-tRNA synthetase